MVPVLKVWAHPSNLLAYSHCTCSLRWIAQRRAKLPSLWHLCSLQEPFDVRKLLFYTNSVKAELIKMAKTPEKWLLLIFLWQMYCKIGKKKKTTKPRPLCSSNEMLTLMQPYQVIIIVLLLLLDQSLKDNYNISCDLHEDSHKGSNKSSSMNVHMEGIGYVVNGCMKVRGKTLEAIQCSTAP